METNPNIQSFHSPAAQSTDWAAVRSFYLTCRSYKQTAEQFGMKPDTIKKRCQREKWGDTAPDLSPLPGDMSPDLSPLSGDTDLDLSPLPGDTDLDLSPLPGDTSPDLSPLPGDTDPDLSPLPGDTDLDLSPLPEAAAPCTMLPTIANFQAHAVELRAPWGVPIRARVDFADKAAFKAYLGQAATQDCLYSGILGSCPSLRVGHDNPAARMVAIVADYDTPMTAKERARKLARLAVKPNFISTSFSGGTHAVWLLEKPLPLMPGPHMVQELLRVISRELRLKRAFDALDAKAFFTPGQYYHAGWGWQAVDDSPIPESTSMLWFDEAVRKSRFHETGVQIPLARVAEELEARFPGRWKGDFTLGARGVRFWDPMADNPTAAIVRENGMTCFTGPVAFRSWEDIFGSGFISQYRAETEGVMLSECYFVDNAFYVRTDYRNEDGTMVPAWQQLNRQSMESFAALRYNLSATAAEDGQPSQLKQALSKIIVENSLVGAGPFIYRPDKIVAVNGAPHLNISFLKVHEPDPAKGNSWGDGFPWTAAFLEDLFPDIIQRERFMSEWAYAYKNACAGTPRNGHTLFVAGPPGVGKNFLSECLYGPSLGGFADASEYLLGRTRFNSNLFRVGVWTCNDTVTKGDAKERAVFAKTLKKMAANQVHIVEAKYRNASSVPWEGRIVVTLNTDPLSLQILPDVEISNRDKICLFKTSDKVLDDKDAARKAREELPALCAYLLNMEIPEHCRGDARFGVRNYLHEELYAEASSSGSTASFGEILGLFAKDMFAADGRLECIEGSATWFLQQMLQQDSLKEMLRGEVTARSIGKQLGALKSSASFPLAYKRSSNQRVWCISRPDFEQYMKNGTQEGGQDELCPF